MYCRTPYFELRLDLLTKILITHKMSKAKTGIKDTTETTTKTASTESTTKTT